MRKLNGTSTILATAIMMIGIATATALAADAYAPLPRKVIIVPNCFQHRPQVGLACVPRVAPPFYDRSTIEDVVDLDRRQIVRPYPDLFAWGP